MRASVVHTRKYHARELKLKNSPTPQAIREIFACAKLQLVNTFNNSIIFFLYLCHRLCLRFVKCASVTNIINLMHGTVSLAHSLQIFNMNVFSLLLKGELQSQLLWLFRQTEKCSEFRRKLLSVNERNFRVLPKSREKFWLEKFSPLNSVIGNR